MRRLRSSAGGAPEVPTYANIMSSSDGSPDGTPSLLSQLSAPHFSDFVPGVPPLLQSVSELFTYAELACWRPRFPHLFSRFPALSPASFLALPAAEREGILDAHWLASSDADAALAVVALALSPGALAPVRAALRADVPLARFLGAAPNKKGEKGADPHAKNKGNSEGCGLAAAVLFLALPRATAAQAQRALRHALVRLAKWERGRAAAPRKLLMVAEAAWRAGVRREAAAVADGDVGAADGPTGNVVGAEPPDAEAPDLAHGTAAAAAAAVGCIPHGSAVARERRRVLAAHGARRGGAAARAFARFYDALMPHWPRALVALLKLLLACAPGAPDGGVDLGGELRASVADGEIENEMALSEAERAQDAARHAQCCARAALALLRGWLRAARAADGHGGRYAHLALLVTESNGVLLLLKLLNRDPAELLQDCCLPRREALPGRWCERARLGAVGNLLEAACVLRLLCKGNPLLVKSTLLKYKAMNIFKRILVVECVPLQRAVLKLVKMCLRFYGRRWRGGNMRLVTGCYLNLQLEVEDPWLDTDWVDLAEVEELKKRADELREQATLYSKMHGGQLADEERLALYARMFVTPRAADLENAEEEIEAIDFDPHQVQSYIADASLDAASDREYESEDEIQLEISDLL